MALPWTAGALVLRIVGVGGQRNAALRQAILSVVSQISLSLASRGESIYTCATLAQRP